LNGWEPQEVNKQELHDGLVFWKTHYLTKNILKALYPETWTHGSRKMVYKQWVRVISTYVADRV